MKIPTFPECNHELVRSQIHLSDHELVLQFQQQPDSGRYFTAIFCRYSPIVYTLIRHSARSAVQADYLFAITWRHILHELGGIDPQVPATQGETTFNLQNWIINVTAFCINQAVLPDVEDIHYSLADTSPPLWCYVEQALENLPPIERLVVLMAQTFHWSETRIAAYLQAEGDRIRPAEVKILLRDAYEHLENALPEDIRAIYLGHESLWQPQDEEDLAQVDLDWEPSMVMGGLD